MINILGSVETEQFFATIAQVVPVLVLALVVEASQQWLRSSQPGRRKALMLLAGLTEVAALLGTAYKPTQSDVVEIVVLVVAAFCLVTVVILVSVLTAVLVRAVDD